MKKAIIVLFSLLFSLGVPAIGLAQGFVGSGARQSPSINTLITSASKILTNLIPFAIGLALVVFLFAIIKYVTAGGGEEKAAARNLMIYGIIALFVMVSVWGLVSFLQTSLGIDGGSAPQGPDLPSPR